MQFRVGGLKGLAIGFKDALANPKETDWNTQLSLQADGLITSDVIWRNYFVTPVNAQVVRDGDTTGSAPASIFISNANVTAPAAMATMLAALSGHPKTTTTTVQLGSHGSAVTAWQTQLNQWIATQSGMSKVNVSGTFDQATQTATEAFQTAANITVDGVVGPATRAAMASALAQKGG
jgi:murein L,D-transpeptidase YcbB/YkuD